MELEDYKPPEYFLVNNLQPLVDFDVTDSNELWLIQFPGGEHGQNHFPEFDGKELKVKLDKDGRLAGIEDTSGKEFDLVSYASQDGDATVIIPSGEESKIVGKICRRASLVRFPEPAELTETLKAKTQSKHLKDRLTSTNDKNSQPTKSGFTGERSRSKHSAQPRSSGPESTLTRTPMSSKRKHSESSSSGKQRRSSNSTSTTVSGSSDRSGKSKKKMKLEK